jgi:hypothetical protein
MNLSLALNANLDLFLTPAGNIATVSESDADVQDVACAVRTWLTDLFYAQDYGIPFLPSVLGQPYSKQLLVAQINKQALSVKNIAKAQTTITSIVGRKVSGIIEVINLAGAAALVHF